MLFRSIYAAIGSATRAVSRIMAQPVVPCALEFIDGKAIEMIRRYSQAELPARAGALLMIETDASPSATADMQQAIRTAASHERL